MASLKAGAAAAKALWDWELSADRLTPKAVEADTTANGLLGIAEPLSEAENGTGETLPASNGERDGYGRRQSGRQSAEIGVAPRLEVPAVAAAATAGVARLRHSGGDGGNSGLVGVEIGEGTGTEAKAPSSFAAAERRMLANQRRAQRAERLESEGRESAAWSDEEVEEAEQSAEVIEDAIRSLPLRLGSGRLSSSRRSSMDASATASAADDGPGPSGRRRLSADSVVLDMPQGSPRGSTRGTARKRLLLGESECPKAGPGVPVKPQPPEPLPEVPPPTQLERKHETASGDAPPAAEWEAAFDGPGPLPSPLDPKEAAEKAVVAQGALIAALAAQRRVLDEAAAEPKWMPVSKAGLSQRSAALLSDAQAAQVQLLGLLRSAIATIAEEATSSADLGGLRELLEPCAPAIGAVRDCCAEVFISAAEVRVVGHQTPYVRLVGTHLSAHICSAMPSRAVLRR